MVVEKQEHLDFADVAVIGSVVPESKVGRWHSYALCLGYDDNTTERSISQGSY